MPQLLNRRFLHIFVLLSAGCLLRGEAALGQTALGVELPAELSIRRVAQALRLAAYSERQLAGKVLLGEFGVPPLNPAGEQLSASDEAEELKPVVLIPHQKNNQIIDMEAPPPPRIRLLSTITLGFSAVFEYIVEKNFDLNSKDADDFSSYEFILPISFSYIPAKDFAFFLSVDTGHIFYEDQARKDDDETILDLVNAFLSFRDIVDGLDLKIGRQRFRDEREWLYDDELDGVRIFYAFGDFALDFSFSELRDKDLLRDPAGERVKNIVIYGYYEPNEENTLAAYSFIRDAQTNDRESPVFYGLHYHGELLDGLYSWLELAHVRGRGEDGKIRGFGFDLGSTYVFDLPFEPSITLGYAFGSGDEDPDDGRDENFRQTGLQGNSADFNGVTSIAYYGEMFDPELSNLHILTAGLGVRPTRESSVELVYHYYRQDEAFDEIRDAAVYEYPDGLSKELGHEIDLIIGFSNNSGDFMVTLNAGYFIPGAAFANDADEAFFTDFVLQYDF